MPLNIIGNKGIMRKMAKPQFIKNQLVYLKSVSSYE
jgi:hypothetical protein